ncbi:MAG: hypothetical protein R3D84_15490 [Paracoccaceae bacterium]
MTREPNPTPEPMDRSEARVSELVEKLNRADGALYEVFGLVEAMQFLTFEFGDTAIADAGVKRFREAIIAVSNAMERCRVAYDTAAS